MGGYQKERIEVYLVNVLVQTRIALSFDYLLKFIICFAASDGAEKQHFIRFP